MKTHERHRVDAVETQILRRTAVRRGEADIEIASIRETNGLQREKHLKTERALLGHRKVLEDFFRIGKDHERCVVDFNVPDSEPVGNSKPDRGISARSAVYGSDVRAANAQ